MRVNLIYHDNGAGTPQTAGMVAAVLQAAGATISHSVTRRPDPATWILGQIGRATRRPRFDINIFLEKVWPAWLSQARHNILVPNQEWFDPAWVRHLPSFDLVLTKTRYAEACFGALGARVRFMGFTAEDARLQPPPAQDGGVLHVAGRSLQKGTDQVLAVWARRPEWPTLTVVQRPPHPGYALVHQPMPNVVYRTDRLSLEELRQLQNSHRLHLCPSEAEGFGHTLVESMSCGAVLVTTDAPPMNELVQPDRGILVPARPAGTQGVGQLFRVEVDALEAAVSEALELTEGERQRMGGAARAWFEASRREFQERLGKVLTALG